MKAIISAFILVFSFSVFNTVNAQNQKTAKTNKKVITSEFKVSGVCGMCKDRIEKAALIKGVKFAEWTKENQMLKVIYKKGKVKEDDIHKALAKAGHDTEKAKAEDAVYDKLPFCCGYREEGAKVH